MVTPPPPGDGSVTDEELRELVVRGRDELAAIDEDSLARLWRSVDDQIDREDDRDGEAPWPSTLHRTSATAVDRPGADASATSGDAVGAHPRRVDHDRRVVELAPTRSRRWRDSIALAAAAAIVLVAGVGIGLSLPGETPTDQPTTLATYDLAPFEGVEVSAAAAVLREDDGARTVQLDLADLPATDGFHEVWLLDPETGALTSLGPVRPDGRYVVPPGTDLAELVALDVSEEPLDGDPGHSGESLLRGEVVWTG